MPDFRLPLTLSPGHMDTITVEGEEVLIARIGDTYYATASTCPHYGGPLKDGAIVGDKVVCPWHHACFHVPTGTQCEPPGQRNLASFPIRREGKTLVLTLPDTIIPHPEPEMADMDPAVDQTIVIVGGGAAGMHAAQELRVQGFQGRVFIISEVMHPPHDRTVLSKAYLHRDDTHSRLTMQQASFFSAHRVALWLNKRVSFIDSLSKRLYFDDGAYFDADAIIITTGAVPRALKVEGHSLKGVFTLRDTPDADALRAYLQGRDKVVVVGSGFIGMEAAASLRQDGLDVTVVSRDAVPLSNVLGGVVGRRILREHEKNGVRFLGGQVVTAIRGEGHVQEVVLSGGETLSADAVLVAIGVRPATTGVHGVNKDRTGGIMVDATMRAAEGVFAAGDVATFLRARAAEPVRIEHWRVAAQQGRIAAKSALGQHATFTDVPFFWTVHFDLYLRYVGHADAREEIIVDGDVEEGDFIAYYVHEGLVQAACGVGRDAEMAALQELMRREVMPSHEALRTGKVDLLELARTLPAES